MHSPSDVSAARLSSLWLRRARRGVLWALVASGLLIFIAHLVFAPPSAKELIPATTYTLELDMSLQGFGDEVRVRTFLPATDERQLVFDETIEHGNLLFSSSNQGYGREARWIGERVEGPRRITYRATIAPSGVSYELPLNLALPTSVAPHLLPYLAETPTIQVSHPELREVWKEIAPARATTTETLRAIFDYTQDQIANAEFKGTTDSLTALRLRQASCNGKSRLFVALARRAGLPARLVGGLILKDSDKKTSHQWVEVFVAGRWVPFCPTNNLFAEMPHRYLALYRGDEVLFTHTKNINFDYRFSIRRELVPGLRFASAGPGTPGVSAGPARLFGAGHDVSRVFLMFPIAALIVIIFRNVVGLESFGVFLPMLIAAACRHTGLALGLTSFFVVVLLAALVSRGLSRLQILQGPRLSVLITVITLSVIAAAALLPEPAGSRLLLLGMFPPVILGFTGERLNKMSSQRDLLELAKVLLSTAFIITVCYAAIGSAVLQTLLVGFPEFLLLIIAAQMLVGRWAGLRLSEYLRFRRLVSPAASGIVRPHREAPGQAGEVLGINARNVDVLGPLNPPQWIEIADDKLQTKRALESHEVPTPQTLAVVNHSADVQSVARVLASRSEFVIKPGHGSGGNGVLVVRARRGRTCIAADGSALSSDDIRRHLSEILSGIYSDGNPDQAFVEERIQPDDFFDALSKWGLCDLRLLLVRGEVLAAMIRIPTLASGGRANLHQGAIGVPVSLHDGVTGPGLLQRKSVALHPDAGTPLAGLVVPQWSEILGVARQAQCAVPLGYIGVDVCVDGRRGPLVLEVNARPGLEIQNVHGRGLRTDIFRHLQAVEIRP